MGFSSGFKIAGAPIRPACPACGALAISWCKCDLDDTTCANGHHYAPCPVHRVQVVVQGDAHQMPPHRCWCPPRAVDGGLGYYGWFNLNGSPQVGISGTPTAGAGSWMDDLGNWASRVTGRDTIVAEAMIDPVAELYRVIDHVLAQSFSDFSTAVAALQERFELFPTGEVDGATMEALDAWGSSFTQQLDGALNELQVPSGNLVDRIMSVQAKHGWPESGAVDSLFAEYLKQAVVQQDVRMHAAYDEATSPSAVFERAFTFSEETAPEDRAFTDIGAGEHGTIVVPDAFPEAQIGHPERTMRESEWRAHVKALNLPRFAPKMFTLNAPPGWQLLPIVSKIYEVARAFPRWEFDDWLEDQSLPAYYDNGSQAFIVVDDGTPADTRSNRTLTVTQVRNRIRAIWQMAQTTSVSPYIPYVVGSQNLYDGPELLQAAFAPVLVPDYALSTQVFDRFAKKAEKITPNLFNFDLAEFLKRLAKSPFVYGGVAGSILLRALGPVAIVPMVGATLYELGDYLTDGRKR